MSLRDHFEQRLSAVTHRMDQIDDHLDVAVATQSEYLRRDAYEVAHESLRQQLEMLRATHAADVAELRTAGAATKSRLAGASAAIIVAVTVMSALMTVLTVMGK